MNRKNQSLLDFASPPPQPQAARESNVSQIDELLDGAKPKQTPKPARVPNAANQTDHETDDRISQNQDNHPVGDQVGEQQLAATEQPLNYTQNKPHRFDPDKPILDPIILARTVWQKKFFIIGFGFLGALIALFVALATPHRYLAEAQLFLDPREIQITDTPIGNNNASHQVLLAVVDSQTKVLTSTPVFEGVIDKLNLTTDPEFSGQSDSGLMSFISSLKYLFSGPDGMDDQRQSALNYLFENVSVWRDPQTFIVYVGMKSYSPETAALVANTIVEQYLQEYKLQQSDFFNRTTTSIQSRLDDLRMELDAAEQAVVQYRAQNDIINVGGGVINEKEMLELSNELARVKAEQVTKTIAVGQLSALNLQDVISESFPEATLGGATLVELRKQYSEAKSNSDALSAALGPRHPQFIAADASVKGLENDIRSELQRIISSTQQDLTRAKQSETELTAKLAVLKTKASAQSSEAVGLRELERKADSVRQLYEALLSKSSETTVRSNLETSNIQVVSEADVPELPATMSRKIILVLGGILGGMIGLAIALILGAVESIKLNMGTNYGASCPQGLGPSNAQQASPLHTASDHRSAQAQNPIYNDSTTNNVNTATGGQGSANPYQSQAVPQSSQAPQFAPFNPYTVQQPAPAFAQPSMPLYHAQYAAPMAPAHIGQVPVHMPVYAPMPQQTYSQSQVYPAHNGYPGNQPNGPAQNDLQNNMQAQDHVKNNDAASEQASNVNNISAAQTNQGSTADQQNEVERLKGDVQRLRQKLQGWADEEIARKSYNR